MELKPNFVQIHKNDMAAIMKFIDTVAISTLDRGAANIQSYVKKKIRKHNRERLAIYGKDDKNTKVLLGPTLNYIRTLRVEVSASTYRSVCKQVGKECFFEFEGVQRTGKIKGRSHKFGYVVVDMDEYVQPTTEEQPEPKSPAGKIFVHADHLGVKDSSYQHVES